MPLFKLITMPFFNPETDEGGSGVTAPDDGVQDDELNNDDNQDDSADDSQVDNADDTADDVDDDLPELPAEQQTAFQKRLEREQKKLEEKLRGELEESYKGKYSRHEQIIQRLGGDPDAIERAMEEQAIANDAHRQAQQFGWSDEETQFYINQQKMQAELQDLRVQNQINELQDNPDYAGIKGIKKQIADKIKQSNNVLTVEEAYWALGGKARAEQVKREAQQREIAKRKQPKLKPQTDSGSSSVPTSSFTPEELAAIKQLGMTAQEAQELMKTPSDLYEYRQQKKKK